MSKNSLERSVLLSTRLCDAGSVYPPLIVLADHPSGHLLTKEQIQAFTMDFMSAYQFGLRNSTNFTQDVALRRKTLHEYHCRKEYEFYHQEVPWLRDAAQWLGMPLVPKFCKAANDHVEAWNAAMCDGADKTLDHVATPGDEPVVYRQFKTGLANHETKSTHPPPQDPTTQRLEVASEMLDHLGAGHETSAIALTYLYHELSLRPTLRAQLRAEIHTLNPPIIWPPASPSPSDPSAPLPPPREIDALPLLHAILMETLRLHAPIPGPQPRITPPSPCTLAGHAALPPRLRVSAMPYALHRNAAVFPEPRAWRPDRWLLPPESAQMKEMLRWFWAFGSGGRMCIGSHLAMQEMKLIVCAIYGNYETEIVNDEGIEEIDAYTTRPRRNALDLRFVRVKT